MTTKGCKATKKHGKIHKQKFRSTHQIERNFLIRMCFFLTQSFATLDLLQIDFISSVPIFYFLFVIKSFDHEGWAKFFAFPEGLETSCYHTATSERRRIRTKADYYYIALRGASIRRSLCGNSEAIVGVAVRANRLYLAIKSVGTSTKCTDEKQLYSHSRILPLPSWHDATTQLRSRRCVAIL